MMTQVPCFKLNTGAVIPALGFGSGTLCALDDLKAVVLNAIKLGYRHFDTAPFYGTEAGIGEGLAEAFQAGLVRREDVFITTKLHHEDHATEDVLPALKKSLSALKVDYLDLYLIHAPLRTTKGASFPPKEHEFLPVDIKTTWKAMEECFDKGLAKAIGVSNFSTKKLQDLLEYARVCPAANQVPNVIRVCSWYSVVNFQVELHPVWQQKKMREFCKEHGIQVIAWSPLGGLGKPWGTDAVLEHPIIKDVALKHQKTPAQVILRWHTEVGIAPVIKSYNSKRLLENINSFDFNLTEEDRAQIESISQKRLAMWDSLCNSTTSPYKSVFELWDGEI